MKTSNGGGSSEPAGVDEVVSSRRKRSRPPSPPSSDQPQGKAQPRRAADQVPTTVIDNQQRAFLCIISLKKLLVKYDYHAQVYLYCTSSVTPRMDGT